MNYNERHYKSVELYNNGVLLMEAGKYKEADSLFTISLKTYTTVDAYYNRALTRKKLDNEQGFCNDMFNALEKKDTFALEIFYKLCTINDTVYLDNKMKTIARHKYNTDTASFIIETMGTKKIYHAEGVKNITDLNNIDYKLLDSLYKSVDTLAQFPGGDEKLMIFLRKNIMYPREELEKDIQGTVVLRFEINEIGKIENIEALRKVTKGLSNEAIRVVKLLPDFIPAKKNGKLVRSAFVLPISFKLSTRFIRDGLEFR